MAYYTRPIRSGLDNTAVSSLVIDIGSPAEDSLMVISLCVQNGNTVTISGTWTTEESQTTNGVVSYSFTRVATASESDPTVSVVSGTARMLASYVELPHVNTTTPVLASGSNSQNIEQFTSPTVDTTGTDKCLILVTCFSGSASRQPVFGPEVPQEVHEDDTQTEVITQGWFYQMTGGVTPAIDIVLSYLLAGNHVHVLAIQNSASGDIDGFIDVDNPPATEICPMFGLGNSVYGGNYVDSSARTEDATPLIGTLDGTSTVSFAYSGIFAPFFPSTTTRLPSFVRFNFNSSPYNVPKIRGFKLGSSHTSSQIDLSDSLIVVQARHSNTSYAKYEDGGFYIGLVNGDYTNGAGSVWKIAASNTIVRPDLAVLPYVFDTSKTVDAALKFTVGSGSHDLTAVGRIVLGCTPTNGSVSTYGMIRKLNVMPIIGGSTNRPASYGTAERHARLSGINTVQGQFRQTDNQFFTLQSIRIGSGTTTKPTIFDSNGKSISFAGAYDEDGLFVAGNIAQGALDHEIYAGDDDYINLSNTFVNLGDAHTFTVNALSSTSATIPDGWPGCIIANGGAITFADLGTAMAIKVTNCGEFDATNADMSGGTTIDAGTGTNLVAPLDGATQAAIQTKVTAWANSTLSNGATALRIEYTGTGDITLNFDNITWANDTVDIHYNSTNASTLTANMQNGANASTSAISGSAVAVNISNDVTFTINISVTGAEVTLLETTTQTEVDHTETATTTYSYVYTYSSDQVIDIQVYLPGYKPYWSGGDVTLGNSDQSITVNLEVDPASQI